VIFEAPGLPSIGSLSMSSKFMRLTFEVSQNTKTLEKPLKSKIYVEKVTAIQNPFNIFFS
jgi:hypothetical protein